MTTKVQLTFPEPVTAYCRELYGYTEQDIAQRFVPRAQITVNELYANLQDQSIRKMLDIGCGIGGTTAALANALGVEEVHLIEGQADKNRILAHLKSQLQFVENVKPWNDVAISKLMVEANVPQHVVVYGHRADTLKAATLPTFDLITSFRSWCHHYPVSTYIELVKSKLKHHGFLVVDVRTNTSGEDQLHKYGFRTLAWVSQTSASPKKTRRLILQKVY